MSIQKIYEKCYVSPDFLRRPRLGVLEVLRSRRGSKNRLRIVKERIGIDFGYAGGPPCRDFGSILVDLCVASRVRRISVLFQVRPKIYQNFRIGRWATPTLKPRVSFPTIALGRCSVRLPMWITSRSAQCATGIIRANSACRSRTCQRWPRRRCAIGAFGWHPWGGMGR